MTSIKDIKTLSEIMLADAALADDCVQILLPEVSICVRSNSSELLDVLRHYFRHIVHTGKTADDLTIIDVTAIECPVISPDLPFKHWSREAGKCSKKDAYFDFYNGRCIHKVRTGMLFLQSFPYRIAAGPCLANSNQVINFINNQYINFLQQQGWLICHAAALSDQQQSIAIAGFSGGGKSTTMLHLMSDERFDYISNDRLFIRANGDQVELRGIPKLPRVNPGTLLNNPQLKKILPPEKTERLAAMPTAELWDLEDKYDVDISDVYGSSRFSDNPKLAHFFILNWSHATTEKTSIRKVHPEQQPELMDAIMKSSGPFYQYPDGSFYHDHTPLDRSLYIQLLKKINVYEVSGHADFDCVTNFCLQELC